MTEFEIIEAPVNARDPVIEQAHIMDYGRTLGLLLRERDGTTSTIRISVEQLAD